MRLARLNTTSFAKCYLLLDLSRIMVHTAVALGLETVRRGKGHDGENRLCAGQLGRAESRRAAGKAVGVQEGLSGKKPAPRVSAHSSLPVLITSETLIYW